LRGHLSRISPDTAGAHAFDNNERHNGNAAVMIPFCNVGDVPGVLMEVRGRTLRRHAGENIALIT